VADDDVTYQTIHGYRRAFVHTGRGPALLLIHGIGDRHDTWRPLIADLARDHTVIAPDLLGHGRSDKPRADYSVPAYANGMRDLLTVLGIERATIVGHSLGGGIAMQFAYQFPERCERIVLVSSGGVGRDVHPLLRIAAAPNTDALLPLLRLAPVRLLGRAVLWALARAGADLGRDSEDLQRVFEALPDPATQRAFVRTLRTAVDWRGQHVTMLDRCYLTRGVPTLLVWGTHDAIVPLAHGHAAHAAMPGSQLEIFEGAGHYPHHADAARFVRVLREFVAGTAPSTHDRAAWRELLCHGKDAAARPALAGGIEPSERTEQVG
jgi:pimeloyl-ACP methyl ester carboxylesterase